MRTLIALAAELNLTIDHMDVKTAFLNGELKETIYISQPEGCIKRNKSHLVCKLNKAMYGLKQASRTWYDKITRTLINLNFKKLDCEPCVFVRKDNLSLLIIVLYVDDLLLFSNDEIQKLLVKKELMSKFEMHDLGKARSILGIRITQEKGEIALD